MQLLFLGALESRGMVKLGNVAPEGMCEAVGPRLQGERTVGSLHIKLNCNLEEQLGSLYKAMEGEATGSCHLGG